MNHQIDRERFEALVRDHHAAVYRSARRVVRSSEDASDVTQSVFLELLSGKLVLEDGAEAVAVLRWWAVRKALTALRGERSRRKREDGYAMERTEARDSTSAETAEMIGATEEREVVSSELDRMQDELRLPLALRFREGLTYKAIAGALGCSEPTAHERVKRGLDRLRVKLSATGFGGAAVLLEEHLAAEELAPVPGALEESLLGLSTKAVIGTTAGVGSGLGFSGFALAALGVATVMVLAFTVDWSQLTSAAPAVDTLAELDPVTRSDMSRDSRGEAPIANPAVGEAREVVASAGTSSRDEEAATTRAPAGTDGDAAVRGRVVDDSGAPRADVDVRLVIVGQKGPALVAGSATTAEDGSFRIVVARDEVLHVPAFRVRTEQAGFVTFRTASFELEVGEEKELEPLRLSSGRLDEPGEWTMTIEVLDDAQRPVAGLDVRLFRRVLNTYGSVSSTLESSGRTDASGRVELAGELLGHKRIAIDPRQLGFVFHAEELGVDWSGHFERHIALTPGLEITGVVRAVPGTDGEPKWASISAHSGPDGLRTTASTDAAGRFTLRGLEDAKHVVRATRGGWSPVQIDGVRPGTGAPVEIEMKRVQDTTSGGSHAAEIHGRFVDKETGEGLTLEWWHTRTEWLEVTNADELQRDVLPNAVFPRPVQQDGGGDIPEPSPEFHLTGLMPGRYAVFIRRGGNEAPAFAAPIDLGAGELAKNVTIEYEPGYRLSGRVLDIHGRPVPKAYVLLTGTGARSDEKIETTDAVVLAEKPGDGVWVGGVIRADDRGRFETLPLPRSLEFRAACLDPSWEPSVQRVPRAEAGAEEVSLDLTFERARSR